MFETGQMRGRWCPDLPALCLRQKHSGLSEVKKVGKAGGVTLLLTMKVCVHPEACGGSKSIMMPDA